MNSWFLDPPPPLYPPNNEKPALRPTYAKASADKQSAQGKTNSIRVWFLRNWRTALNPFYTAF